MDALWEEAGMTGEVIGKKYHAWGQAYDDTNARRERVQAAGLVVCEATPVRIRRYGAAVLRDLERVYQLNAGRGLPPNVRVLLPPSIAE